MTSRQKQKGNSWELFISAYLGETLGGNFMRVPSSGAYIGKSNAYRKANMSTNQVAAMKSDLIPPDDLRKLNIEAKSYANITFHHIIDGCCKQLNSWIEQTEAPADDGDLSFTIFKITRKGSWCVFKRELEGHFKLDSYVVYKKDDINSYIVTDFKSFFKNNKDAIRGLAAT